ncbi:MAG: enoyl-CoA hydratase/isomerase family protein [Deltaproteobacteria bacterium]|nr:enoyl-CoA hydratase/isomerase family protein [Deltaproteobacteria bacterium]
MSAITATQIASGQVLRICLSSPPRNILDSVALRELVAILSPITKVSRENCHLKAILLAAEGPNFSMGASVAEHSRAEAPAMLSTFVAATRALVLPFLPVVAAVKGQCLGGGLELVSLATRVFAHASARLGQPEIRLAALAPVASVVLPRRIGQARAEDLLLSGRTVESADALAMGLVDAVTSSEPEAEALAWIESNLLPHSAAALRRACLAARTELLRELDATLPSIISLYQDDLLMTEDAEEGIRAFLEKRPPRWSDR